MSTAVLELCDEAVLGEAAGWQFGVARLEGTDQWVGFQFGEAEGERLMDTFSDGLSREAAVRLTCAIVRERYGGFTRKPLSADPEPAVDPEEFRCEECGQIGCTGALGGKCEYEPVAECMDDYDIREDAIELISRSSSADFDGDELAWASWINQVAHAAKAGDLWRLADLLQVDLAQ